MGYNHGYALKKHKEMWKKAEEEYRQLGMTEEQINAIYEMEKAEINSDRVYYEKKIPLSEAEKYSDTHTNDFDSTFIEEHWYEYIKDPDKRKKLMEISADMRKAFYLNKVMKISQDQISLILAKPQRTISYWIVKISKILK